MIKDIRRLEIELFSFCNRQCEWCPNKEFDRLFDEKMNENTFIMLLQELKKNGFDEIQDKRFPNIISFNRYCEPMSDIDILKARINKAKSILNNVLFIINTNGDYMTKENIDGLNIDWLNIMDYDCKGEAYWRKKMTECGIMPVMTEEGHKIIGLSKSIQKVMCYLDWPEHVELENRGGYFNNGNNIIIKGNKTLRWKNSGELRTESCIEPEVAPSIDYNGNVMPCCHLRSDNPEHTQYILGNIYDNTLEQILNSRKAVEFTECVGTKTGNDLPEHCRYCQKTRQLRQTPHVYHSQTNID